MLRLVFTWFVSNVVRYWIKTLEVKIYGTPLQPNSSPIFSFFHGQQMLLMGYPRREEVSVLVSFSRDGMLQKQMLKNLGFGVVRGSSSRGGAAGILALIKKIKDGGWAALATDGPRGPYGKVKPGPLYLSKLTSGQVIPVAAAARRSITLRSTWDRFIIPFPWSEISIVLGDPISIPKNSKDFELEIARKELEISLKKLTEDARAYITKTKKQY